MALVNISSARQQALRILESVTPPGGVELLSYKRNRSVAIIRHQGDRFIIREQGYVVRELEVGRDRLSRLLKTLIKREFPRSRKVRFFRFTHPDQLARKRQKI